MPASSNYKKRRTGFLSGHSDSQRNMKKIKSGNEAGLSVALDKLDRKRYNFEVKNATEEVPSKAEKLRTSYRLTGSKIANVESNSVSKKRDQPKTSVQENSFVLQVRRSTRQSNSSRSESQTNRSVVKRKVKSVGGTLVTVDGYSDISDSDEEEWLGWDSETSMSSGDPEINVISIPYGACTDEIINHNLIVDHVGDMNQEKEFVFKGFSSLEQTLSSSKKTHDVGMEDYERSTEYKCSGLRSSKNMMSHPASDISKVLKSKKNLKTKKNFQFKFNNFRRENGSVGTVLSAEENTFSSYSHNIKGNWYKVGKEILKPCSVHLTRLSQIELVSCGYKRVSGYNHNIEVNNLVNKDCDTGAIMKKSVNNKATKSSVDKTQLHLELEKVASTFASEVKTGNCFQYEDYFNNPTNFALAKKEKVSKGKGAKPDKVGETNGVLKGSVDTVTHKNRLKKHAVKKLSASVDDHESDSDEGEFLGWNSKVTPLDQFPGAEIVSVEENMHIENIINWNMKVDSESDMDVEEVFLLTDLLEMKQKTANTANANYSTHEGWHGWPEQKSTTLCYVFNV